MPYIIPVDSTGSRKIDVALGDNVFRLRTYYLPNIKRWLMDITDTTDNPIIMGICLNVGVGNLVKGKSTLFEGQTIRCVSTNGSECTEPDSLGNTCLLYYYPKGETAPNLYEDKMIGD